MNQEDYARILRRWSSPFADAPNDMKVDMHTMLTHVAAQNKLLQGQREIMARQAEALEGARKTMQAIARSVGGIVEIPFALIDQISDKDSLLVSDVETPHGLMKRFAYAAHAEETTEVPQASGIH